MSFLILVSACSESPSIFKDQELSLHVDAEVTECWITLSSNPLKSDATYIVQRDTSVIYEGRLQSADTLLHDINLQPATTYSYSAWARKGGDSSERTNMTVTTMDTTSHDFEWEIYEFGGDGAGSSVLYDVAIINENDIWAVGEIHTKDTDRWNEDSTQWIPPYNAVHWDGQEWELRHIYVDYRGNPNLAPLKGVFALDNGEVVFSSGLPYLPSNNGWKLYHLWDMGILDENDGGVDNIWGTSFSNLYFAGRNGTIVHYNGQEWTKLESGTDLDVRDIYGAYNPKTKSYEIMGVASNVNIDRQIKFFMIEDKKVTDLPMDGLMPFLDGIWFKAISKYYIVGSGIFKNNRQYKTRPWSRFSPGVVSNYHTSAIDANDINDIITVGDFGEVIHFNGISWTNYFNTSYDKYLEVDIKKNLLTAVATDGRTGKILLGRR